MKKHPQLLPSLLLQSSRTLRALIATSFITLGSAFTATAQFTPGSGGAIPNIPELREPESSITSLRVTQTDRAGLSFSSGDEARLDLGFHTPSSYGATSFDLQKSADGVTNWETLYSTNSVGDNFSFNPGGIYHFRLLVHGGPRDGQVSNVVLGEVSEISTYFSGWGGGSSWTADGINSPWVGHSLSAYFNAKKTSDASEIIGGIGLQWYRRNPQNGAMILIPGATQSTYTTTEDDLGGYQLICRGTGDGINVGGYAEVSAFGTVVIFNQAEATAVSRSGFTLNLSKSVPSLIPDDLKLSFYDGLAMVEIPITAVTAHAGNASFDIEANVPTTATSATLSNRSGVWKIGSMFGEGEWTFQEQDLMIDFPAVGGTTFAEWVAASGIPVDRRETMDRNGPLLIQNLLAYAMGLDPMTATQNEMPGTTSVNPVAGTIHLIYRRAKNLSDVTLTPRISSDLDIWSPANVVSETILQEGGDWEKVDATIEFTPGLAAFFRFAAEEIP